MELSCPSLECEEPSLSARTKGRVGSSISNKFREIFFLPNFSFLFFAHPPTLSLSYFHLCRGCVSFLQHSRLKNIKCQTLRRLLFIFEYTIEFNSKSMRVKELSPRVYCWLNSSTHRAGDSIHLFICEFIHLIRWQFPLFHLCWYWINTQVARS